MSDPIARGEAVLEALGRCREARQEVAVLDFNLSHLSDAAWREEEPMMARLRAARCDYDEARIALVKAIREAARAE